MDRTAIIPEDILNKENLHIKIFTQTADFRRAMFQFSNVVVCLFTSSLLFDI